MSLSKQQMIKSGHWNSILLKNVVIETDTDVWLTRGHQIILWKKILTLINLITSLRVEKDNQNRFFKYREQLLFPVNYEIKVIHT